MATQDEVKVYRPEVIEDAAFPTGYTESVDDSISQSTGTANNRVYSQAITKEQVFPKKKVAVELIGQAINTKSQKIIKTFEFTEHGAIQIGKYVHGVSGEIKISPQGIVAKNKDGIETLILYGDTGDAIFKGTVQAGSVISGDIIVGGSSDGNGTLQVADAQGNVIVEANSTGLNIYSGKLNIYNADGNTVIDSYGLVSSESFRNNAITYSTSQNITGTSFVDLTNSSSTFTLARSTGILFIMTVPCYLVETVGSHTGDAELFLDIDGNISNSGAIFVRSANNYMTTRSCTYFTTLAAGSHTVKLKAKFGYVYAGTPTFVISEYTLTRILLGA